MLVALYKCCVENTYNSITKLNYVIVTNTIAQFRIRRGAPINCIKYLRAHLW